MRGIGLSLMLVLLSAFACSSSESSNKNDLVTDVADNQVGPDQVGPDQVGPDQTELDQAEQDHSPQDLMSDTPFADLAADAADDTLVDDTRFDDASDDITPPTCPANIWDLEGDPCTPDGLSCGNETCVNICGFCNIMLCSGGTWSHLEAFPMECFASDYDVCLYIESLWNGCVSDITTCEDVGAVYGHYTQGPGTTCTYDSDCQVLNGQCGSSLGGCYEAVNMTVTQEMLVSLGWQYGQLGCTSAVCDCAPPPTEVYCDDGKCEAVY